MPLVGFVEIIGGVLFIIPRTRALGTVVIFPVMIGIILVHTITAQSGLAIPLALLAINLWVLFDNKDKYFQC